jgi:hypothetical protein
MSSQSKQPNEARRDAAVEALLSRQSGMNGSSTPCPDAEILAAYLDHTLDDGENDRWESHFAGCERCQDTLTAMADSAPVEVEEHAVAAAPAPVVAAPPEKPRRRSSKLWLVAIAAAAAVVAFIVLRPTSPPSQAPKSSSGQTAQQDAGEPVPVSGGTSEFSSSASGEQPRKAAPAIPTLPKNVNPQQIAEEPHIQINPVVTPDVNVDGLTPALTQVPNPPATATSRAAGAAVARAVTSAAPQTTPTTVAPQISTGENALRQAYAAGLEGNQVAKKEAAAAPAPPSNQAGTPFASVLVFPLKGNVIWQIGGDGLIDKSSDSGMTWVRQQSGTNAQLIAGSAPDNQVCWLVGDGVILRTVDGGATWTKVSTPISGAQIDWTAVYATDADNAHVASIDGRRFATKDGGQTWSPVTE